MMLTGVLLHVRRESKCGSCWVSVLLGASVVFMSGVVEEEGLCLVRAGSGWESG